MKVLIVDDDSINRMILEGMLQDCEVVQADNGQHAIQKFKETSPDLVLMDIMMPVMNGYEAIAEIKRISSDRFVPIIVLTALSDDDELADCLTSGADDFLTKPFSQVILRAKINAAQRMQQLFSTVNQQREEINRFNEQMIAEQEAAANIYKKMIRSSIASHPNINPHMSPMSLFNGDMFLMCQRPDGGVNLFLGDATGHGLPAAIGALPVSDVFHVMTEKGLPPVEIIKELNQKLCELLPTEIFLCGAMLVIQPDFRNIAIWNGGLPDILIANNDSSRIRRIESIAVPLGIIANDAYDVKFESYEFTAGERIYIYSDGITEAEDTNKQMFGDERLTQSIMASPENTISKIMQDVNDYTGGSSQSDDLSIIEVKTGIAT